MSNGRKLTDEQLEQMAAHREAGKTYAWLAAEFGVSVGAIRWQCLRLGADRPDGHRFLTKNPSGQTQRGGRQVRPYSPNEDAFIQERKLAGDSNSAIARALGRKPHSILGRVMTLAMTQDRQERAS